MPKILNKKKPLIPEETIFVNFEFNDFESDEIKVSFNIRKRDVNSLKKNINSIELDDLKKLFHIL